MQMIAYIENKGNKPSILEAIQTETIDPKDYIELSVMEDSFHSDCFDVGNYVGYVDEFGCFYLYIIQTIEECSAKSKNIICESIFIELSYELCEEKHFSNRTGKEIITYLLKDSTWVVGDVDDIERHDFTANLTDKLTMLNSLANVFKCDLYFTYTMENGELVKKVNMKKSRGEFTGKRFEYGKDIKEIIRTVDLSDVRTAMVGIGKNYKNEFGKETRTSFTDTEWSVENGNPLNKPLGLNYIEDPIAKELYGLNGGKQNRMGFYENGEAHDPEYLLAKTYQSLLQKCTPKITYEANVVDLYRIFGHEHERVCIGDEVVIIDKEFKRPLIVQAKVIEIRKNLLNPSDTTIILGNYKGNFTDDFDRLKQLEEKLDENSGIWDDKLDGGDKAHYCEFGTLVYSGTYDKTLTYNFSQVYVDLPVIHAFIQLKGEDIDSTEDEGVTTSVQPIMNATGQYIGGKVRVHRKVNTQREFVVTIQAMCSTPLEVE